MNQQWMSIVEYARQFDISDMTVRRRIKTGKIPAELKEGKYYIPVPANATHRDSPRPYSKETHRDNPVIYPHSRGTFKPSKNDGTVEFPLKAPSLQNAEKPVPIPNAHSVKTEISELLAVCRDAVSARQEAEQQKQIATSEKMDRIDTKIDLAMERIDQLSQKFEDMQVLIQMLDEQELS